MRRWRTTRAQQLWAAAASAAAAVALVGAAVVPASGAAAATVKGADARGVAAPRAAQRLAVYHGGPVEHSSNVYVIFWVPKGYSLPDGYTGLVTRYFTDVAHDSYQSSNLYSVPTQYYDGKGSKRKFESYSVALKTVIVDTKPVPKNGCKNYVLGDSSVSQACVTAPQIQKRLKALIAAKNLPTGLGTNYFVFTPQGVASCKKADALGSNGCYNPLQYSGYCAYHSHFGSGKNAVLYAQMPYSALQGCASGQTPNANPADAVLNNVAHEHNEMMTDPLGNGWYDGGGREIADKCHLTFGTPRGATSAGQYNQVINGNPYWLQELWSNRAGACVQRNTFRQPTASFVYKPAKPVHGKKVTFTSAAKEPGESRFTFKWTFPDGVTATTKNVTRVFSGYVFVAPVVLVVCDSHGGQTRVIRNLTVQ